MSDESEKPYRAASIARPRGWWDHTKIWCILLRSYPTTEIAFARYFVHMVLVTIFLAWRDPRLMISRRPVLQMLRSMLLLGTTLFGMLALKIMPLVDFSASVWVAPVLVAALSVFILHEKVSPGLWASVFAGLIGVWVIIGRTGMDFSLSMLFPFLAALANALYQITTRLLHGADSSLTTLFYSALAGVLFCGGFLPFAAAAPNLVDGGLMLLAFSALRATFVLSVPLPRRLPISSRRSAIPRYFGRLCSA